MAIKNFPQIQLSWSKHILHEDKREWERERERKEREGGEVSVMTSYFLGIAMTKVVEKRA